MRDAGSPYSSRLALPADAEVIARHRARMFRDMNAVTEQESEELFAASLPWLKHVLGAGEYVGWLVLFDDEIVAGGRDSSSGYGSGARLLPPRARRAHHERLHGRSP